MSSIAYVWKTAVDGLLAACFGLLVGMWIPGDGNPGHIFSIAVCGLCGWLFWWRHGKCFLGTVGICAILILVSWPVALELRNLSHAFDLLNAGQWLRNWLILLLPPTLSVTGILHWCRTRRWWILVPAIVPLAAIVAYFSSRSPETARRDRINWCGVELTITEESMFIYNKSDIAIQAAFEDLKTLPGLRSVQVMSKNITDEGVCLLAMLPHVDYITLDFVHISQKGFKCISQMPYLQSLKIRHQHCTEEDISELIGSRSLERLLFEECEFSDAGLRHIGQIKPLQRVAFLDTPVSLEALDELNRQRPDLEIGANKYRADGHVIEQVVNLKGKPKRQEQSKP
jgi:hypothetical protein